MRSRYIADIFARASQHTLIAAGLSIRLSCSPLVRYSEMPHSHPTVILFQRQRGAQN